MAWPLIAMAAMSAAGGALGAKNKDKQKITREKDPTRTISEGLLMRRAILGATGREDAGDRRRMSSVRGEGLRAVEGRNQALLRSAGMAGITSPGILENINANNEAGITGLINARNQGFLSNMDAATGIAQSTMQANPPYMKSKIKEAPMWTKMLQGAMSGGAGAMGGMKPGVAGAAGATGSATPTANKVVGGGNFESTTGPMTPVATKLAVMRNRSKLSGLQALYGGTQ